MRRKRTLLLAAAGLTILSACGGAGSAQSKDTTIQVIATDYSGLKTGTAMSAYWNGLARTFEARNPHIHVEIRLFQVGKVDDAVAALVRQGKAPDIAQLDTYSSFAAADELYSVDSLFPISIESSFIPSLAAAGSVNRTQYGIPYVVGTRPFFYNKKLFAHAGITRPPETWDDIKADAIKLKADGVKVPVGLPLGPQEAEAETMMWMLGNEGGYTDGSGAYTIDSDANVETFTWLRKNLVDTGLTGPRDPATTNVSDAFADFMAGRTGMLDGHITLLTQAKAAGIDVGVVPLPGRTGLSSQTLGNADWVMAFKQPGHLDADSAFLRFLYSREILAKFQKDHPVLPVTADASEEVWTNPAYRSLLPFMRQLPTAAFYPVNKPSWVPVADELRKFIGRAVHGRPKEVLRSLQDFAEAADTAAAQ